MAKNDNDESITSWPDLAIQLYKRLTGEGSTINYQFENLYLGVPDKVGEKAVHTKWLLNGTLKISTKNA